MNGKSEVPAGLGLRSAFVLAAFAALALSLAHLVYQYVRLGDAYTRLLWP